MDDSELIRLAADEPNSPILDCQGIFAHPAISATTPPRKSGSGCAVLLDGLALAVALFKEANIVLDIFIVRVLAPGGGKRRVRALVVAAQHV